MEISVEFDKGNAAGEPWWEEVHQIPLHLFCVCDGTTPGDAQGLLLLSPQSEIIPGDA